MQSAKEVAANISASAKAGMEKTKATIQEKVERMTTSDPARKEMATQKKEERFHEAERLKHEARGGPTAGGDYPVGGGGPNTAGGARPGYGSGNTY